MFLTRPRNSALEIQNQMMTAVVHRATVSLSEGQKKIVFRVDPIRTTFPGYLEITHRVSDGTTGEILRIKLSEVPFSPF